MIRLVRRLFDSVDLAEGQEQTIIDVPRHEADRDPRGSDDIGHSGAEEARILIKNTKTNKHDQELPEAQPKLTSEYIGTQNAARNQNRNFAGCSLPNDRRLIHVKLSVFAGVLAPDM